MRSEYTVLIFDFSKFSGETPSEEGIKMEFKTTFINFAIVFHNTVILKTEYTILMQIKKKKEKKSAETPIHRRESKPLSLR